MQANQILRKSTRLRRDRLQLLILVVILIVLCAFFTVLNPDFIKPANLHSILLTSVLVGLMAVGESICIIAGYFDMAVGMIAALSGILLAFVLKATHSLLLGLAVGLGSGVVFGLIAGCLISYLGMNAFITTFALQSIYRGIIFVLTDGFPISLMGEDFASFTKWGQYKVFGMLQFPIFAMLLVYIWAILFMKYRKLGRSVYLSGNNPRCAHISGINLHKIHLLVFVICDVLASISGILFTSRTAAAQPFLSEMVPMEAIAAAVVGGVSLLGGKGNIAMTFVGLMVIYVIKNGLTMAGVPDFYQYIATGLILYIAVLVQTDRKAK